MEKPHETVRLFPEKNDYVLEYAILFLGSDSFYRTFACASAAVDAESFVDNEFAIAFLDSLNGAYTLTGTAGDALIADCMSHCKDPP